METIYTTVEEYLKYENGLTDNRIDNFMQKVLENMPKPMQKSDLEMVEDETYISDHHVKKYYIKPKDPTIQSEVQYQIYIKF